VLFIIIFGALSFPIRVPPTIDLLDKPPLTKCGLADQTFGWLAG